MLLGINEALQAIPSCKAIGYALPMFPRPSGKICCGANVKRVVAPTVVTIAELLRGFFLPLTSPEQLELPQETPAMQETCQCLSLSCRVDSHTRHHRCERSHTRHHRCERSHTDHHPRTKSMVEWSRVGGIRACRRIEAPATSRHLRSSLRPLV